VWLPLGRWFEANGKVKMGHALDSLAKLLPDSVHQVDGNVIRDVPRSSLQVGDEFRVLAGERCGVDGRIVAGFAEIDEQLVTGESRAVTKGPGDSVFSGTLNLDGDLLAIVTAAAGEETVSRLLAMVQKARRAPGQYQRLADRIAVWFVPAICLIALATAAYRGRLEGLDAGILAGLAVVLIACPCALGLATPMAVWTAMSRAAQGQVLFRSGQSLEQLADANLIFFDKTGTLTDGKSEVDALIVQEGTDRHDVLDRAASLAAGSNHVLSTAIRRYLSDAAPTLNFVSVATVPGKGLSARLIHDGQFDTVYLGSPRFLDEQGLAISQSLERSIASVGADTSLAYIGWGDRVHAAFVFRERLRPEAAAAIELLHRMELPTIVLTGDRLSRATQLGMELQSTVMGDQLPEDKATVVERARCDGKCVAMVGDGINDAPALATADVGIAMGCGTDLSRDSASVCLLSNDLIRLPWTVALARHTVRVIRQNLFWAFVYNVGGIALAVSGRLNPVWAGAAMVASSLLVITNSLRLNRFPEPPLATPLAIVATQTNLRTSCQQSQSFGSDLAKLDSSVQELQATT
jgi:heavy metal translocating P-type ATPase